MREARDALPLSPRNDDLEEALDNVDAKFDLRLRATASTIRDDILRAEHLKSKDEDGSPGSTETVDNYAHLTPIPQSKFPYPITEGNEEILIENADQQNAEGYAKALVYGPDVESIDLVPIESPHDLTQHDDFFKRHLQVIMIQTKFLGLEAVKCVIEVRSDVVHPGLTAWPIALYFARLQEKDEQNYFEAERNSRNGYMTVAFVMDNGERVYRQCIACHGWPRYQEHINDQYRNIVRTIIDMPPNTRRGIYGKAFEEWYLEAVAPKVLGKVILQNSGPMVPPYTLSSPSSLRDSDTRPQRDVEAQQRSTGHQSSSHSDSDESSNSSSSDSREERDIRRSRPVSHGIAKDHDTEHPKEDEDPFNDNKEDVKSDVLDNENPPFMARMQG